MLTTYYWEWMDGWEKQNKKNKNKKYNSSLCQAVQSSGPEFQSVSQSSQVLLSFFFFNC